MPVLSSTYPRYVSLGISVISSATKKTLRLLFAKGASEPGASAPCSSPTGTEAGSSISAPPSKSCKGDMRGMKGRGRTSSSSSMGGKSKSSMSSPASYKASNPGASTRSDSDTSGMESKVLLPPSVSGTKSKASALPLGSTFFLRSRSAASISAPDIAPKRSSPCSSCRKGITSLRVMSSSRATWRLPPSKAISSEAAAWTSSGLTSRSWTIWPKSSGASSSACPSDGRLNAIRSRVRTSSASSWNSWHFFA
mmetsp:Transcript_8683/g.16149  ORF Transcript_8683/g.16149 Transcript_8683/m.16149 type:complete len:252 (-) Transcript_8683:270-1025(-)